MKKLSLLLAVAILVLAAIVVANTLRFGSRQLSVPAGTEQAPDAAVVAQRLAQAVRFQTISHQDPAQFPGAAFDGFHAFLERSYPRVKAALVREKVNGHSLLYEWRGSDPALKPILLMAHQDVVPADPASLDKWTRTPFSGEVADGFIWGRGTIDDKGGLMAVHEAVEALLAQGFRPARTVYFAFGHDEEVGGRQGAAKIAELLKSRGMHLESVLDEGQVVTTGIVPGFEQPVALVGIAEKGYLSVELLVQAEGGHSSMPPKNTAVGILAAAIAKLEATP